VFPKLPSIALASVCLLLPACVVSEVPLSSPDQAKPDEALLGLWLQREESPNVVAIGRYPYRPDNQQNDEIVPRGIMTGLGASLTSEGELPDPTSAPLFFASKIGNESYLNIFERKSAIVKDGKWEVAANTRFMIVKYRIQKNVLELWNIDTEKAKAALGAGAIRGEIAAKGLIRPVILKNGMALTGYLAREGSGALFAETPSATFVRAKIVPLQD